MRPLLLVHAVLAIALVGAALHHAIACAPWLWGRPGRPRLATIHAGVVPLLAVATFAVGLFLYPTFKTDVRLAVLEVPRSAGGLGMPWLGRLFDLKEMLSALGSAAAVGVGALALRLGAEVRDRPGLYCGLSIFCAAAMVVVTLLGLYTVAVRAVP